MIIGFTGLKGSGKTTASLHIQKEYGFKNNNFKDALVAEMLDRMPKVLLELKTLYDMNINELFSQKPPIMRALMHNYGTELRRGDDPDYWVRRWAENLHDSNYVVDDVRFLNEAHAIRDRQGVIIRIVRHDQDDSNDQHVSEQEQNQIKADFTIYASTGNHTSLYKQIDDVIQQLKSNVD